MPPRVEMEGMRFGRLLILCPAERRKGRWLWRAQCDCGTEVTAWGGDVRSGKQLSCGCLQRERTSDANRTHGQSGTYLYELWAAMIKRCHNPNDPSYDRYGALGISVCDEWRRSFEAFRSYVGDRPADGMSIDRIQGHLGYRPGNVRWATRSEQSTNRQYRKRDARYAEIVRLLNCGHTQKDVAGMLAISESTIRGAVRATNRHVIFDVPRGCGYRARIGGVP